MNDRGLMCRNCGNNGTGFDGRPCVCKLTPEWAERIAKTDQQLHQTNRQLQATRSLLAEVQHLHTESCRYDHNDFCQEHYSAKPCLHERIREVLR